MQPVAGRTRFRALRAPGRPAVAAVRLRPVLPREPLHPGHGFAQGFPWSPSCGPEERCGSRGSPRIAPALADQGARCSPASPSHAGRRSGAHAERVRLAGEVGEAPASAPRRHRASPARGCAPGRARGSGRPWPGDAGAVPREPARSHRERGDAADEIGRPVEFVGGDAGPFRPADMQGPIRGEGWCTRCAKPPAARPRPPAVPLRGARRRAGVPSLPAPPRGRPPASGIPFRPAPRRGRPPAPSPARALPRVRGPGGGGAAVAPRACIHVPELLHLALADPGAIGQQALEGSADGP